MATPISKQTDDVAFRYFIRLAYNGAPFHGWQIQPNATTVQSVVEDALSTVMRRPMAITGAGRTDTGVNARCMYAHFDTASEIDDTAKLAYRLNSLVGKDIAIYSIFPVAGDAHARFDAISRTYKYFIGLGKSPFDYPFCWTPPFSLDIERMNEAAAALLRYSDFTSFSKLHSDAKTNICHVSTAEWKRIDGKLVFTITADRFLRNMVRAIVGTLVEVGRHNIDTTEFCAIVEQKDRCAAGSSVPGHALFLWDIVYPYPVGSSSDDVRIPLFR